MRKFWLPACAVTLVSLFSHATVDDFDAWLKNEDEVAVRRLNENISAPGTRRGVILASPSTSAPNYYYYWVRDGAMVMRAIFDRLQAGDVQATAQFKDYVTLSRDNQDVASRGHFSQGEPRFNVDGSVNTEPWGRPQNDGPALRALTMIKYARVLLKQGDRTSVERDLYHAEMPARTVIKTDLEYVAHHWQDLCIDLWEEAMGHHFFTQATQAVALREGAQLATDMGDPQAAAFYLQQADLIEAELAKHWDASKNYYLSALDFGGGPDHQKPTQLDVSVLLAALFVEQPSGLLSLSDDRMIKTAEALESTFGTLYPINSSRGDLGTSIGRYKEDVYFGGNPWVLTTAAFAEWNFRLATRVATAKSFVLTETQAKYFATVAAEMSKTKTANALIAANFDLASNAAVKAEVLESLKLRGDAFLKRIRVSAGLTGYLSEQFDLKSGSMLSARDLSWSYASLMRANEARDELATAMTK